MCNETGKFCGLVANKFSGYLYHGVIVCLVCFAIENVQFILSYREIRILSSYVALNWASSRECRIN